MILWFGCLEKTDVMTLCLQNAAKVTAGNACPGYGKPQYKKREPVLLIILVALIALGHTVTYVLIIGRVLGRMRIRCIPATSRTLLLERVCSAGIALSYKVPHVLTLVCLFRLFTYKVKHSVLLVHGRTNFFYGMIH